MRKFNTQVAFKPTKEHEIVDKLKKIAKTKKKKPVFKLVLHPEEKDEPEKQPPKRNEAKALKATKKRKLKVNKKAKEQHA